MHWVRRWQLGSDPKLLHQGGLLWVKELSGRHRRDQRPATAARGTCLVAGVMRLGSMVGSSGCPLSPGDNIQAAQASGAHAGCTGVPGLQSCAPRGCGCTGGLGGSSGEC